MCSVLVILAVQPHHARRSFCGTVPFAASHKKWDVRCARGADSHTHRSGFSFPLHSRQVCHVPHALLRAQILALSKALVYPDLPNLLLFLTKPRAVEAPRLPIQTGGPSQDRLTLSLPSKPWQDKLQRNEAMN